MIFSLEKESVATLKGGRGRSKGSILISSTALKKMKKGGKETRNGDRHSQNSKAARFKLAVDDGFINASTIYCERLVQQQIAILSAREMTSPKSYRTPRF